MTLKRPKKTNLEDMRAQADRMLADLSAKHDKLLDARNDLVEKYKISPYATRKLDGFLEESSKVWQTLGIAWQTASQEELWNQLNFTYEFLLILDLINELVTLEKESQHDTLSSG